MKTRSERRILITGTALGCAAAAWFARGLAPGFALPAEALAVTTVFATLTWLLRGASPSGALAGAAVAFIVYVSAGRGEFLALIAVFVLAWSSTRLGRARKQRLGTAERSRGRSAGQVLANLGAAAALSAFSLFSPLRMLCLLGALAALAEAAADTVSSECGQALSSRAYLITSLQPVAPGTDGGISAVGTMTGAAAAVLVAWVGAAAGLISSRWAWLAAVAGILSTAADSVLGATLERRGRMGNNAVNFTSTVAAAAFAMLLATLTGY